MEYKSTPENLIFLRHCLPNRNLVEAVHHATGAYATGERKEEAVRNLLTMLGENGLSTNQNDYTVSWEIRC